MVILQTPRLYMRKIKTDDYSSVCAILQDIEVMYAWEHAFSNEEVVQWIDKNIMRYNRDRYSYWAVIEKVSNKLVGVTGLISEQADDENYVGVGYIYRKSYWGNGYAFEAASACVDYAFNSLHLNEITAQIRPENKASRKVAERLGMSIKKQFIKHYKNKDMPHLLYSRIL
ncbi:GNAT family N-acetyltransferase [Desulfosporosinus youngiae]|uniref:Acetyltransferase, ribosomal protein N-acetylase n=1 Tax=Desulfosporosinus youngiae DSM 17734 TaxID=768710 RepID=H5XYW9_9FIRM|nr:GNAT family N-acetyltransferase [Desulfosporosinus youngiae]EHQ91675.1 acetyltransferase, ribosomal protein N-acetylase [Desulfosporosinus youngiae DSM 17734]